MEPLTEITRLASLSPRAQTGLDEGIRFHINQCFIRGA